MSDRSLEGRVVVLTGGAGLLGRNHSKALSRAGARVVVADIDETGARAVADALPSVRALAVEVDVTNPDSVRRMVEQVIERFGAIDTLVNNAAIDPKFDRACAGTHTDSFEEYPL